jgi:DNA replication and repair protein RecF
MYLSLFSARNYRNLEDFNIAFKPGLSLIWGDNAQGKTNLLEAIYCLGNLKGFRSSKNSDLIQWGKRFSTVSGCSISPLASQEIQIRIEPSQKTAHLNGKPASNAREFFSTFPVILFCPEEVALFDRGPAGRRTLLDRAVFLMENDYLDKFRRYHFVLKTRNVLLRQKNNQKELDVWTEAFVETAIPIILSRNLFIKTVTTNFVDISNRLTGNRDNIEIEITDITTSEIEKNLRERLEKFSEKEKELGYTLVGPHTEGPVFLINGKKIRNFASQGQKRSFLLAFKISQLFNYKNKYKKTPILLLDDLGSELDVTRQRNFFDIIMGEIKQIFFTTTDNNILKNCGIKSDESFFLTNGQIKAN